MQKVPLIRRSKKYLKYRPEFKYANELFEHERKIRMSLQLFKTIRILSFVLVGTYFYKYFLFFYILK
jgi:hypothetical protein